MKYHPIFKTLAIFLAACALIVSAIGALGIFYISTTGLYTGDLEDWQDARRESVAEGLSDQLLHRYTATVLGGCSPDTLSHHGFDYSLQDLSRWFDIDPDAWEYSIKDSSGNFMEDNYTGRLQAEGVHSYSFTMSCTYPLEVPADEVDLFDDPDIPDDTGSLYRNYYTQGQEEIYLYYYDSPNYTVTIRMAPGTTITDGELSFEQVSALYEMRYLVIGIFLAGLAFFALCAIYLCFAAGRSSDGTVLRPAGLNRLPLDLYLVGTAFACYCGLYASFTLADTWFLNQGTYDLGIIVLALSILLVTVLIGVCFLFACAAQFKVEGGWWWKHTLVGRILVLIFKGIRYLFRRVWKLISLLPLIWQWLLTGAAMGFFSLFFFFLLAVGYGFWIIPLFLSLGCNVLIICYGAYSFGVIRKGAQQMAAGDLNAKIPTEYLIGCFKDFAEDLNALSDAAMLAAQSQMKSERMRTELITNVSHDIKTPLTSIINYVDLLEKPHTEEEGVQYLDVLSRQSQRLKKLIDDLMDMSKASTGNMSANIVPMNLAEAVNQALGEFADKLEQEQLTVVFRQPEQPVMVKADGRITWRVLSNLLSNIVKYALPGTRVYVEIQQLENSALLSLKNISREELNISADELTERFVRGDASRNTEGSGLGLNIAQSMMELQKGRLNLFVDGDLFKVTLTFPTE